jgi:Rod binding domain-containing protein
MAVSQVLNSAAVAPMGGLSLAFPAASAKDSPAKILKGATDFEALLIGQMLRSAREAGGGLTGDNDDDSEANSSLLELGEQQFAQALSNSGGVGIGKMIVAGLNHANR